MLAAISLFLPFLLGLGLLPLTFARNPWPGTAQDPAERATMLAATLALGIAGFYALLLAVDDLTAVLLFGASLSLLGWGLAAGRGQRLFLNGFALGGWPAVTLLALLLAGGFYILLSPLALWDPRLIWFQQGQLLFEFGDMRPFAQWGHDPWRITHADYPKLVATLSAASGLVAGVWNDYGPKLALLALLAPPSIALLSFWRERITLIFIAFAFFAVPREFMWNGYLDGYLALYAGFAMVHLGRWLEERAEADLLAALAFLGVAGGLKNEANLLYAALVVALGVVLWRRRELRHHGLPAMIKALLPAIVAFAGFILWHWLRRRWGLQSDLAFGPSAWAQMAARLGDPTALMPILRRFFLVWPLLGTILLAGAGFLLLRRFSPRLPAGSLLAFLTALLVVAGLLLVYLMTPNELGWQLATSSKRTLMLPRALIFAGLALWMRQCERAASKPAAA